MSKTWTITQIDSPAFESSFWRWPRSFSWWLTEVDMAIDPKFSEEDYQVAKEGKAVGGYSFLLEIILPIFDGDFDTIVALHKEMKNHAEPKDGVYKS